jgi:hypothetical protein
MRNNKKRLDGRCAVILPVVGLDVYKFVHVNVTATNVYDEIAF